MKRLLVCIAITAVLAEPPVDNRYLPPQQGSRGFPSQTYGPPTTGGYDSQRQTDAVIRGRPSSNYGAPSAFDSRPSSRRPSSQYGPPSFGSNSQPSNRYGPPSFGPNSQPSNQYGPPSFGQNSQPSNQYGPPSFGQNSQPPNQYGPPSFGQKSQPSNQYGPPSFNSNSPPSNQYIPPTSGSNFQPSNQYGQPSFGSSRQGSNNMKHGGFGSQFTPGVEYRAPSQEYGAPNTGFGGNQQYSQGSGFGSQSRQYLPPGGGGYSGSEDGNSEPANYNFEYMVKDDASGNDFGHRESRQGDRAEGQYYVLLPDGRKQTVQYEADQDGYKPRISYEDTGAGQGYSRNQGQGYQDGYQGSGPY